MPNVLISPATIFREPGPHLDLLKGAGFEWEYPARATQLTESELLRDLHRFDAVLAGSEPYTKRVFASAPKLRVLARVGVGYDAVDLQAATEHGVVVTTAPGTNHEAVGEHALGMILALARGFVAQDRGVREGAWPRTVRLPLRGRTLGIIGLGRTGKAVAERAAAFKMQLLACEPVPDMDFVARFGVTLTTLDRLLSDSDYVTLHVPLTPETRHMIDAKRLALMQPSAFLINASRGEVVREADLVDALRSKRIAGAALDVYEHEPVAAEHPLCSCDKVLLTPHVAGHDLRSREDMALSAARSVVEIWRGDWPSDRIVNPEVRQRAEEKFR